MSVNQQGELLGGRPARIRWWREAAGRHGDRFTYGAGIITDPRSVERLFKC